LQAAPLVTHLEHALRADDARAVIPVGSGPGRPQEVHAERGTAPVRQAGGDRGHVLAARALGMHAVGMVGGYLAKVDVGDPPAEVEGVDANPGHGVAVLGRISIPVGAGSPPFVGLLPVDEIRGPDDALGDELSRRVVRRLIADGEHRRVDDAAALDGVAEGGEAIEGGGSRLL